MILFCLSRNVSYAAMPAAKLPVNQEKKYKTTKRPGNVLHDFTQMV